MLDLGCFHAIMHPFARLEVGELRTHIGFLFLFKNMWQDKAYQMLFHGRNTKRYNPL
jgi:hypothetical protein